MRGNSNGNIHNGGFIAKAKDLIVFSNFEDNNYLYKMNYDGSKKIKLSEISCKYINVWEEWAYYTDFNSDNIYRTHILDGETQSITRYDSCVKRLK